MLTVLCHTADDDGNRFTDTDIVNHIIFLMMAAHDTSTSTLTTMAYHGRQPGVAGALPRGGERIGDGPLDIDALDKLETFDLVVNECLRMMTRCRSISAAPSATPRSSATSFRPGPTSIWARHEPPTARVVDRPKFIPPASRSPAPSTSGTAMRSRRSAVVHLCIGMVFGQLEIKSVMHRVLRNYRRVTASGLHATLRLRRHAAAH